MCSDTENRCVYCNELMPNDRPYNYCMEPACYKQGFKQTEYVILGVHKSTPIICAPTDDLVSANRSYMNAK